MPIAVYLLSFVLPALVMTIPAWIFKWNTDYQFEHLYLFGTLGQLLMDLPAVLLIYRLHSKSEDVSGVKNRTRDPVRSAIVGIVCAMVLAAIRIVLTGKLMGGEFMGGVPAFTQSLGLESPWKIIAAVLALLAYGPGEALFVVYLILAFDQAAGNSRSLLSAGVIITSILWALPHVFNVVYFGVSAIPNVLIMFFIGIVMGLLLKKTRSSLGPMIFWTLVNGTSA
jgi:membrane protease YdiL (CAAX protease family)